MSILFTFPGQGAQRPGMLHGLPDHPEVRRTVDETAEVLAKDPLSLDTRQALESTVAVQLCLLIAGVAMRANPDCPRCPARHGFGLVHRRVPGGGHRRSA